jgi:dUTP pyrophosphatase
VDFWASVPKNKKHGVLSMQSVPVKKLSPGAKLPTYGSAEAAGADLYACLEQPVTVAPGETVWIPTGIALEIPKGCAGLVYARSGLSCKRGLAPANKVGVIDSDYRGELVVVLHNHGNSPQRVEHGERIAQMVITPVLTPAYEEVKELSSSDRGTGGFGSTGS